MSRDLNKEHTDNERKYGYSFDYDVMHHYMLKSIKNFKLHEDILELGCFEGRFTERLVKDYKFVTAVEGSSNAYEIAKNNPKLSNVNFICSMFEDLKTPTQYSNILMSHVLEHLDDPVQILKKINNNLLADDGYFFLICPNANAPSRQIAVKMGLISHNSAVTPAEAEHGHHITYTLDTLERDATQAGLDVVHRSGIFFKSLANFQWDKILQTDIISQEYLEGCYQLGQQYPDLCSSIMLVCRKGN